MPKWIGTIHWSAGTYQIGPAEMQSYHHIIGPDGTYTAGAYKAEDQQWPYPKGYAAHTSLLNNRNIGYVWLGMKGYREHSRDPGKYPITRKAFERLVLEAARDALKFDIYLHDFKTHYERGLEDKAAGKRTGNIGKIDVCFLPCFPELKPLEVGPFIRSKIEWYRERIDQGKMQ